MATSNQLPVSGAAGAQEAPLASAAAAAEAATKLVGSASRFRTLARTIVETAACPPDLKRGEGEAWSFSEFRVAQMLGQGNMSSVLHCVDTRSRQTVVVKMYHKDHMNSMNIKQVSREIELHAALLHPNIIKLYAAFEDPDGIYLVEEFAPRGDLYGDLSRRGGYMTETHVAKNVLLPFLSALSYMHSQGILHRDIKPENIMLGESSEVKLGDFGLAINLLREKPMSRVGTLDYMPPEIVRLAYASSRSAKHLTAGSSSSDVTDYGGNYGLPADVWCVGILAYELLVGGPPFEAETKEATYTRILKTEPHIPSHLHEHARDFIQQALKKDPSQRPTVHQLLRHAWLRAYQRPRSMHMDMAQKRSQPRPSNASDKDVDIAAVAAAAAAALDAARGGVDGVPAASGSTVAPSPRTGTRPGVISRSAISFNSPLTGRFTPFPSKPSALNQMVMRQQHAAHAPATATATVDRADQGAAPGTDTIPAVMHEGRRGKGLAPEGSAGKLAVLVTADSSGAGTVAVDGAAGSPPADGAAPGAQSAKGGLIRAVKQGGPQEAGSLQEQAEGASSARGQPATPPIGAFAKLKRKLSGKGLLSRTGGGTNQGASLPASARGSDEPSAWLGGAVGNASGVQTVRAPSILQLLSPASASRTPAKHHRRTSSTTFLSTIGRNFTKHLRQPSRAYASRLSGVFPPSSDA